MRNVTIGDRFKLKPQGDVWEVTRFHSEQMVILTHVGHDGVVLIGSESGPYPISMLIRPETFDFIGNFSKSNQFKTIYDILNEP